MNGLLDHCKNTGCGFKCCSFGSTGATGYTLMLPNEYETADKDVSHLKVIDDDYFGGKKVQCTATDLFSCNGGYKPVQCRVYPIWVKDVDDEIILKSLKCPLTENVLDDHKEYALSLMKTYKGASREVLNNFLHNAAVDRYKVYGGKANIDYELRILSPIHCSEIEGYEATLTDPLKCYKSNTSRILESLSSECSVGIFVDNRLVSYSLCFFNEYGAGFIEKCFVHKDFRGQGWQVEMLRKNLSLMRGKGAFNFFTTVSPQNIFSIRGFRQVGFIEERTSRIGKYERVIMTISDKKINAKQFIKKAIEFKEQGYVYLYGGKGKAITKEYVEKMAVMYPDVYTDEILNASLSKIGKIGVDCSGFITLSASVDYLNSDSLYDAIEREYETNDLSSIESGMIVWKNKHVGIIFQENSDWFIIEAKDTMSDITILPLSQRISDFDYYGRLKYISY